MKFKIQNSKLKTGLRLLLVLIIGSSVTLARAQKTPFYQTFLNPDGSPQTNPFVMTAYPPVNIWTVVGSNIVYGNYAVTFAPNTNGYVSNSISPNTYQVLFNGLNSGFYAAIPNTTNVLALANYVTNVPVISGNTLGGFGLVTNWLGYTPPPNTTAGIVAALGWTPPTNTPAGIVTAEGFQPATNTPAGIVGAEGFQPATNNPVYVTNIWISSVTWTTNASGYVTNLVTTLSTNILKYQSP